MKSFKLILEENDYPTKISDLHQTLSQHYNFKNNQDHELAIKKYTDDSEDLNHYHWNKGSVYHDPDSHKDNETERLDAALKHHKTPHPLHVWSGTGFDPRDNANSEGIVHHPGYLSTSINKQKAKGFARFKSYNSEMHLLKIDVPEGYKGAYVAHVSHVPQEKEFILPRGLNMRIKGHTLLKTKHHKTGKSEIYHIHHMEVV